MLLYIFFGLLMIPIKVVIEYFSAHFLSIELHSLTASVLTFTSFLYITYISQLVNPSEKFVTRFFVRHFFPPPLQWIPIFQRTVWIYWNEES